MYQPPMAAGFLIGRCPIAEDLIIAKSIPVLSATIAGVALDRVDIAVFDFFHDSNMVRRTVLPTIFIPVKEDNISGPGLVGIVLPEVTVREPLDAD